MENLNELYQAIWAEGRTVHAPCVGDKGGVPRCRALCSSVPDPVLPGAGEMPRSEGIWDGGW